LFAGAAVGAGEITAGASDNYLIGARRDDGGQKWILVINVQGKKVEIEFTQVKETLKIACREKIPAGKFLKSFDISGEWKRVAEPKAPLGPAGVGYVKAEVSSSGRTPATAW
jgi:hypothetical protein